MAGVVDADTHIIEHDGIWELLEPEMYPRRPVLMGIPSNTLYKENNGLWLIDGAIFPKPTGKGSFAIANPASDREKARTDIDVAVRHISDPQARVRDMDKRGVDVEVVFPTLFLAYLTDDAALEAALCHAYNKWLAQAWKESDNRLRWVVVPPLHSVDVTLQELEAGKANGAVGVFFRGVEGDRSLADPYFFPIYAKAEDLGMAVCVHTGAGAPAITNVFDRAFSHNLPHVRSLPLFAFRDIVAHKLPERFPGLNFGFIEASASWVPYVLHHLQRSLRGVNIGTSNPSANVALGPQLFRDYRLFIACETDEDLPYLLTHIGEDNMLVGSDYGHEDQSRETGVVAMMRSREDIPTKAIEKILDDNPRRFYGL